jgi:hypothetical protein
MHIRSFAIHLALAATIFTSGCTTSSGGQNPLVSGAATLVDAAGLGVVKLGHEHIATFRTAKGDAIFRRNRLDGMHDIMFPRRGQRILVPEIQVGKFVGTWRVGGEDIVALRGTAADCPVAYVVVAIAYSDYASVQVGDCVNELSFDPQGRILNMTTAKAASPMLWQLSSRELVGPVPIGSTVTQDTRAGRETTTARKTPAPSKGQTTVAKTQPMPSRTLEPVDAASMPKPVETSATTAKPTVKLD